MSTIQAVLIALLASAACLPPMAIETAAGTVAQSPKGEKKKEEKFKVKSLTQGLGLYAIGSVSPDGQAILLIAQKPEQPPNLYVMNLTDNSIRPPLTSFKWGVVDPAWSPDSQSVAFGALSDTASFPDLYYLELKGGKLRQLTKNAFTDREPVFSPDGKRLYFASDESPLPDAAFGILHVATVPVAGGKAEFFTEDESSSTHPAISRDGKSVLLVKISDASGRHSLWQYSPDGKAIRDITETKFARIHRYIYHPDGNTMVIWGQEEAERQDQVYLLDVKTGAVRDLPEPDLPKRSPSLSPDGKLLALVGPSRTGVHIYLYDFASGEMKQLTEKGFNNYSPVFISNSVILFGSDRDKEKELYQIDLSQPVAEKDKEKEKKK